jgi:glycosyltransferase involved in cell wall biosynthesis
MKIAQVAPLYESVPPKFYGGTERVVSYLTEELVRQGHEVTLFASGDSVTRANLVPAWHRALRLDKRCIDHFAHHVLLMEKVFQVASDFDIIHWHIDYFHFPLSRRHPYPQLTTLHGRLDLPDLVPLYKEFTEMPVVSISDAQRAPLPWANWQATVYHGYPIDTYRFAESPGEYLAFLGRICPEKRVDTAIAIAKEVGMPLKIAAKVDKVDEVYFADQIKPLLDHPSVDYVGEIGEGEKSDFLGGAAALLFPIDWPEPFGLVMIEAMACGTPVIARNRGSVPEVLEQGVTGFICDGVEDSVLAVKRLDTLSRKRCREVFESRFTVTRMAEDYMKLYERAISDRKQR